MAVTQRSYVPGDFDRVSDFLVATYAPGGKYPNWLQPRWEYMHYHPMLNRAVLDRIGLWEDDGEVVALATCEADLGEAFIMVRPGYSRLKGAMLDYAERKLSRVMDSGRRFLRVHVNDFDHDLRAAVKAKGYKEDMTGPEYRTITMMTIARPFPEVTLPVGFGLKSLQDDDDIRKVDRVMWRGFNHPGEPPGDLKERRRKLSAPHLRKDLNIVVEAPSGHFVAYGGIWYVPGNRVAYVEPVATDPDYRRMGLGRAAVLESVRRAGELGAKVAFVESAQPFYLAIGFVPQFERHLWVRRFD